LYLFVRQGDGEGFLDLKDDLDEIESQAISFPTRRWHH
jgi:hypothetical protein